MPLTATAIDKRLDDVATLINNQRNTLVSAISIAGDVSTELAAIATDYASVITDVGNLPAGTWEDHVKDRLAKYTTEFVALKAVADSVAAETV